MRLRWMAVIAFIYLCAVVTCMLAPDEAQAQTFRTDFDPYFRESAVKYLWPHLPDDDWRWWKAQCIQESQLIPDAVSWAGATGVCQLMGGAARDAGLTPSLRVNPRLNIRAGAFILRRGIRTWWPRDTRLQRLELGWACYNAGCGHVIHAQSLCDGARLWADISPCLPEVTGQHARETIHYVDVIPRWYQRLVSE